MKRRRSSSLRLEATAWVGEYTNVPDRIEPEYRLELHLCNDSDHILRFDAMIVTFSGRIGSGLNITVKDSPQGEEGAIIELGRGESWSRTVRTNGYTGDLLRDCQGNPLTVAIVIKRRALRVDGPFHGFLPSINDLPFDASNDWDFDKTAKVPGKRLVLGPAGAN